MAAQGHDTPALIRLHYIRMISTRAACKWLDDSWQLERALNGLMVIFTLCRMAGEVLHGQFSQQPAAAVSVEAPDQEPPAVMASHGGVKHQAPCSPSCLQGS